MQDPPAGVAPAANAAVIASCSVLSATTTDLMPGCRSNCPPEAEHLLTVCRFDPGDEHVRAMLLDQRYRLVGVGSPTDDLDADPYKKTVQRIQPKWMPVKDDCGLLARPLIERPHLPIGLQILANPLGGLVAFVTGLVGRVKPERTELTVRGAQQLA